MLLPFPPERTLRQKPNFICVPYGVFDFVQGVGPWDSTTQIWDVDGNFQDEPIYWFRLHQTKHLYFFVFPALKPVGGLEYFSSHHDELQTSELLRFWTSLPDWSLLSSGLNLCPRTSCMGQPCNPQFMVIRTVKRMTNHHFFFFGGGSLLSIQCSVMRLLWPR